jgi:hypothetical protein
VSESLASWLAVAGVAASRSFFLLFSLFLSRFSVVSVVSFSPFFVPSVVLFREEDEEEEDNDDALAEDPAVTQFSLPTWEWRRPPWNPPWEFGVLC